MLMFLWVFVENLNVPLDADKIQFLVGSVAVVEQQLLTRPNEPICKNTDTMVTVDHHHLRIAIRIDRVVYEASLIAFARCIHNKIIVQVK